jgi:hypothetical protein
MTYTYNVRVPLQHCNQHWLFKLYFHTSYLDFLAMSVLDKFRKGAQRAGIQATAFTTKVATGSRDFAQTFSLPGEAEKAAKILDSFLGKLANLFSSLYKLLKYP